MANNYFQFKQFTIQQQHCAMKVCTDSCLFGSVLPTHSNNHKITSVLDVGTGTGLLSLMYAQRNPAATITALEIDTAAAVQATENLTSTTFTHNITIINDDYTNWEAANNYELIICNPPFYENQLLSTNNSKNTAHHSTQLTLQQLLTKSATLLSVNSSIVILLPTSKHSEVVQHCAALHLSIYEVKKIYQNNTKPCWRVVYVLTNGVVKNVAESDLFVYNGTGMYSQQFVQLLQPYYLHL